jgi:hypothetical protein
MSSPFRRADHRFSSYLTDPAQPSHTTPAVSSSTEAPRLGGLVFAGLLLATPVITD